MKVVKPEELLSVAKENMLQALRHPDVGRVATKRAYREDFGLQWAAFSDTEPEGAWEKLTSESTQGALKASLDRLKSKKSRL